jgi:trimethyllysine dioxygenase
MTVRRTMRVMDVPRITHVAVATDGMHVRFAGHAEPEVYGWFWLRDHSEDPTRLDPDNLQRVVDTFSMRDDVHGVSVALADDEVTVSWSDGSPPGRYRSVLLASVAGLCSPLPPRRLWSAGRLPDLLPTVACGDVMHDDAAVREWLLHVHVHGFAVVRDVTPTREAAEALARRIAYPRESIFGAIWTLSSEVKPHDDSAYSTSFLEPHTDGTYSHDGPGLQMFVGIERDGTGGESIVVDGFAVAEQMRMEDPDAFDMLTMVDVPARYLEKGVHLHAERPAIRLDRSGAIAQVSFNNYDRAPFRLPPGPMAEFYRAYRELHRRLNERDGWLLVPIEPGDALIVDNWRVLHGRMAYTGRRVFEGCYHNHEDFESRLRVLL